MQFPFRVWRSISSAAGDGPVCLGGDFAFCAEADRINVYNAKEDAEEIGGHKIQAVLGAGKLGQANLKNRFDGSGFKSVVFDDMMHISTTRVNKTKLFIVALHRSGLIRSWCYEGAAAPSSPETSEFTPLASWIFACRTGAPRFLQCHQSLGLAAVTSSTGRTRFYDISTGSMTHHFEHMLEAGDLATCLILHQKRGLFLIGSEMGWIVIGDLYRKCIISSTRAHSSQIIDAGFLDIAFDASDEKKIPCFVSLSRDRHIKLWSLKNLTERANAKMRKKLKAVRPIFDQEIAEVSFGTPSATVGPLIDRESAVEMARLKLDDDSAAALSLVLTKSLERSLEVGSTFSKNKGESLPPWLVLLGTESGAIQIYDLVHSRRLSYKGEHLGIRSYDFVLPRPPIKSILKTENALLVVSTTGGLIWWPFDQESFEPNRAFRGSGSAASASLIVASPKSSDMTVYSCTVEGDIVRDDVRWSEGGSCQTATMCLEDDGVIASIDRSACGNYIAFVTKPGRLAVVDLKRKSCILEVLAGTIGPLVLVAFSRRKLDFEATTLIAGRPFVVTVGTDYFARVWPISEKNEITSSSLVMWKASDKPLYCMCLSRDDRYVFTAGADKLIKVWQCDTGEAVATLKGHKSSVTALALHPSEPYLASASADGTLRIWQTKTHTCVLTLSGLSSNCHVLAYTADGKKLLAGCSDGALHTWEASTAEEMVHLGSSIAHNDQIHALGEIEFANKRTAISCSMDGAINLWRDDSVKIAEEQTQISREEREDLAQITLWLNGGDYASAIRAACRWRKIDAIGKIVEFITDRPPDDVCVPFNLSALVQEHFTKAEDLEILLLAAIHFCKQRHSIYIAHWIANAVLTGASLSELRRVDGFHEFCSAFTAKTVAQMNRWERLNEKSFLLHLVASGGQVLKPRDTMSEI